MSDDIDPERTFKDYLWALGEMARETDPLPVIELATMIADALRAEHTVFCVGNGGSFSTAQHFVSDLTKGTGKDCSFKAFALDNPATLTALGNDVSFESVFLSQIRAFGAAGDLLIGLTVSGRSLNLLLALTEAHRRGLRTAVLTGARELVNPPQQVLQVPVPSFDYGIVETVHLGILHWVARRVRRQLGQTESR